MQSNLDMIWCCDDRASSDDGDEVAASLPRSENDYKNNMQKQQTTENHGRNSGSRANVSSIFCISRLLWVSIT